MNANDVEDFVIVPGYIDVFYLDEDENMQSKLYSFKLLQDFADRSGKLTPINTTYESGIPVGITERKLSFEEWVTDYITLSNVRDFVNFINGKEPC